MTLLTTLSGFLHVAALCLYLHPIHVSITEIEFDEKDQALEIMMRVFIDDLELTLRNSLQNPELDILNPKAGMTIDGLVGHYLTQHVRISLDGKPREIRYLGHEQEGEAFIFYCEVSNVKKWNSITIYNDIIMATHDDQSNIVHVYVNDKVKSLRLTRDTPADKLTFE
jgi:hypothetical protein